jgi:hypothetical protein
MTAADPPVAYNAIVPADPVLGGARLTVQLGPDRVPAEAFTPQTVERVLALR